MDVSPVFHENKANRSSAYEEALANIYVRIKFRANAAGGRPGGLRRKNTPPHSHYVVKSESPLTKICPKKAKIHVKRRKLRARSARWFPLMHVQLTPSDEQRSFLTCH